VTGQGRRDPEDLVFGTGLRGRELTAALTHAEIKDDLSRYILAGSYKEMSSIFDDQYRPRI
jgi:hypothetical protein